MRLSSVILFAAFAVLASASPIDSRSSSLWKRVNGRPQRSSSSTHSAPKIPETTGALYYDHNGLVRIDEIGRNGRIVFSYVKFLHERSFNTFVPTSGVPWRSQDTPYAYHQEQFQFDGALCLDLRVQKRIQASYLERNNGEWMIFYLNPPTHHTHYTTSEYFEDDGTYVRNFSGPNGVQVLSGRRSPGPDGQWEISRGSDIPWHSPPTRLENLSQVRDSLHSYNSPSM